MAVDLRFDERDWERTAAFVGPTARFPPRGAMGPKINGILICFSGFAAAVRVSPVLFTQLGLGFTFSAKFRRNSVKISFPLVVGK